VKYCSDEVVGLEHVLNVGVVVSCATQLSHGHMHVDFAHKYCVRFIHSSFHTSIYLHLPQIGCSCTSHLVSCFSLTPSCIVCSGAFALKSCSSHKAIEAFLLMYWLICGLSVLWFSVRCDQVGDSLS